MADSTGPSSLVIAGSVGLVSLILVTWGYYLGQGGLLQSSKGSNTSRKAKSWPNSYDVTIHPDSSDEELMNQLKAGQDQDSDEDSEEMELSNASGEVKLVLAVRTDLGMGKGSIANPHTHPSEMLTLWIRQNCRPMLARDTGLLQVPCWPSTSSESPQTMGSWWATEDRGSSQVRGRLSDAASSSHESRSLRKNHTRRW